MHIAKNSSDNNKSVIIIDLFAMLSEPIIYPWKNDIAKNAKTIPLTNIFLLLISLDLYNPSNNDKATTKASDTIKNSFITDAPSKQISI